MSGHARSSWPRFHAAAVAVFVLLLGVGLSSCDRRPIDATAALPAIGSSLPEFTVPSLVDSSRVSSAALRGAPTFLALWSVHCPFQGPAMATFDSLRQEFAGRGIQFVVLADDPPGPALNSVLRAASWWEPTVQTGVADGRLATLFDRSRGVAGKGRVEFVLPSFLLVDAEGRVAARAFGAAGDVFRPVLDSLVRATP